MLHIDPETGEEIHAKVIEEITDTKTHAPTREQLLKAMGELLDAYEKSHPNNNDVGCLVGFFDDKRYVWNGSILEELEGEKAEQKEVSHVPARD